MTISTGQHIPQVSGHFRTQKAVHLALQHLLLTLQCSMQDGTGDSDAYAAPVGPLQVMYYSKACSFFMRRMPNPIPGKQELE